MSRTLPPASTLFALADELEALMECEAGELCAIEWDDLNEYAIQLRTTANLLSGVAAEYYVSEMVKWAETTLASTGEALAIRKEESE